MVDSISELKNRIEEITEQDIQIEVNEAGRGVPEGLLTNLQLHDELGEKYWINIHSGDTKVGDIEYIYYPANNAGLIDIVALEDGFKGEGLGTLLTTYAINDLKNKGVDTIYRLPVHPAAQIIAERQGFKPADDPRMEKWLIKHIS